MRPTNSRISSLRGVSEEHLSIKLITLRRLVWLLAWAVLWASSESIACAQVSCGGFRLDINPGPLLVVTGASGATNDCQIEYADSLEGGMPWRMLTNFAMLPQSRWILVDPGFGSAPQRYYRLRVLPSFFPAPRDQVAAVGASATLSASAISPCSPASYQWQRSGTNLLDGDRITGTTSSNLVIANVEGADAGIYHVVASTPVGSISSGPVLLLVTSEDTGVPYGVSDWLASAGNHRARVAVTNSAEAVWARIPWRRRDPHPEARDIQVMDAATGLRVTNVLRLSVNQEFADVLFQPATVPGEYHIYYMPFRYQGYIYGPKIIYLPPTNIADSGWTNSCAPLIEIIAAGATQGVSTATVLEFQSISEFDRFDPMEVTATSSERQALIATNSQSPYLLYPEDRRYPIRMSENLPLRWIRQGPSNAFYGEACRGEFYAFQLGVYAASQSLRDLSVSFFDLAGEDGTVIPASALRCFNLRGTNWLGEAFTKTIDVPQGRVQPLWFGVAVPENAKPQIYRGSLILAVDNAPPTTMNLAISVDDTLLRDGGDSEIWKHSRLRWLDSSLGLDDEVCPPYEPIAETNLTVTVLGRQVHVADGGLLDAMVSFFSRSVDGIDAPAQSILAGPMRFVLQAGGQPLPTSAGAPVITYRAPGALSWEATNNGAGFELLCRAKIESDGYINYQLTLRATATIDLEDISLEVPINRQLATYMMGLGYPAGFRQARWDWHWTANANNVLWIGEVNAGLSLKLKNAEDRWDMCWIPSTGYRDWANGTNSGCTVSEVGPNTVMVRAYTGPRLLVPGETLSFNFGLLPTPLKVLDKQHWRWRYYQAAFEPDPSVSALTNKGVTVLNIHSGQPLNPYINYPYLTTDSLGAFVREAHQNGIKVKPYCTVRELSNHAAEFWALRSLGEEVLAHGDGGIDTGSAGTAWLCEHLLAGYAPGWQHPLGGNQYDAAVATSGLSRWMNYYIEGVNWLARNVGIDGLYVDGIGYDREVTKRLRKVLLRANPGGLLDFHSGDNFGLCGNVSTACEYAEHFPYLDSIWFGEFFDPNRPPDYWLLEMSGIPFGLFGEMLHSCGNPWRGMIFGMSTRIFLGCDARNMWKLWDDFGIAEARMVGYWDDACPVRTTDPAVLATAYIRPDRTLIALASWSPQNVDVRLLLDGAGLGLDVQNARLRAPAISGIQSPMVFYPSNSIPVEASKGWLLILEPDIAR